MKIGQKIAAFCMALCLGVCFPVAAAAKGESATRFVPVLRFIASSDTHVQDGNDLTANRMRKMLDMGYSIAREDAEYNRLDALIVAGDLTDDGTPSEFEKFGKTVSESLRDETQFLGVVAKNHDGYKLRRRELRALFTELTGCAADFHTTICGYHFIGISVSANGACHYDRGQLAWLKAQLNAAVADDPDKPVFVIHHEHVRNTVYGSSLYDGWGVPYFTEILKQYPQVVDFSGHSHFPLNDPRSVWQGAFTAIGTGAVYYSEFTIGARRTYHPADAYETATCWIVEADAAHRIRLRGMDILSNECLCEYILENPADPENRDYAPEAQRAKSAAPSFDENAALTVTSSGYVFDIQAPKAHSNDGMTVTLYRAYIRNAQGVKVAQGWTLPVYYRGVQQDEIVLSLKHLGSGEYTVGVIAENAYGGQSAPIETTVTISRKDAYTSFFSCIVQRITNVINRIF